MLLLQISAAQRDKVLKYIESGVSEGAKVATGGQKWPESKGFYVEPTILEDCKPHMKVVQEEVSPSLAAKRLRRAPS
jgi:aldehyde dehydrogenase (NAD+)